MSSDKPEMKFIQYIMNITHIYAWLERLRIMPVEDLFVGAEYVSTLMNVSIPYAYKVIKKLNSELSAQGYLVVRGKVNKEYLYEKIYRKVS